jgi:hypothetical protein
MGARLGTLAVGAATAAALTLAAPTGTGLAMTASGTGRNRFPGAPIDRPSVGRQPSTNADPGHPDRPSSGNLMRVVDSNVVVPGVRFTRIRLTDPPEDVGVLRAGPRARVRALLVRSGTDRAPYATVSSAVDRSHAVAGTNG